MNEEPIAAIRRFNRFYTSIIGLLNKHILDSPYSLAEARVLFEISGMKECTARKLMTVTAMDEGYLSRIIDKFSKAGLVRKIKSPEDRRVSYLSLTASGSEEFKKINRASQQEIRALTQRLNSDEVIALIGHMQQIESILSKVYEKDQTG